MAPNRLIFAPWNLRLWGTHWWYYFLTKFL